MSGAIKRVVQNQSAWLCVSLLPFFFMACKDSPPGPPHVSSIQLLVEDASCTEAWLKITLTDSNQPRTIALKRDGQTVLTAQLTVNDSILIDEGLLPNHAYTYQAVRMRDSVAIDASANAQLTTLDTTSHNWVFSLDTLGDGNSSVLYDVAIVSDTLVYAVGEIYLRDSTGQIDPQAYNLAKWDGNMWELMRIQFYTFCGQSGTGSYPAKSIFAFGSSDIWIAMDGSQVVRWNGQSQSPPMCTPVSINKLWGENSSSVYAIGNGGGIAHYTSGTWHRVESGTSAGLSDIWGYTNTSSGRTTILGAVSSTNEYNILSLSAFAASDSLDWPIDRLLGDIWMGNRFIVYASGASIWRHTEYGWRQASGLPQNIFFTGVRGSRENNLFAISWRGMLAHFNGTSWHQHTEIPTGFQF